MVRPEMVTVRPEAMWNTRLWLLPFTARFSVPGPEIVTFLATSSSPLVNPIVPVTAKPITSPSLHQRVPGAMNRGRCRLCS